jgi:hypothetical protein
MQILSNGTLDLSIVNSAFVANRAQSGAGISAGLSGGSTTIVNSTFRRNMATIGGSGAIDTGPGVHTVTLRNTILWGNKAGGSENDLRTFGSTTAEGDHCDIGDRAGLFTDVGGNIDADPRLSGDLHLRAGSPAIDAGTCTGAPALDFEGDTRPAGIGCDMGADEFVP